MRISQAADVALVEAATDAASDANDEGWQQRRAQSPGSSGEATNQWATDAKTKRDTSPEAETRSVLAFILLRLGRPRLC